MHAHVTHTQKNITVKERPLSKHCLDSSDVFILDLGLEVFQVLTAHHPKPLGYSLFDLQPHSIHLGALI